MFHFDLYSDYDESYLELEDQIEVRLWFDGKYGRVENRVGRNFL